MAECLSSFRCTERVPEEEFVYPKAIPKRKNIKVYDVLVDRSLGFKHKLGFKDNFDCKIYKAFTDRGHRISAVDNGYLWGGIFGLDYSLDGKLLAATTEGGNVIICDPARRRFIKTVEKAHDNCVNCVRFLDYRTFATGSDDNLIKLWDIRSLKSSVKTLSGHSNWVKNIEWSEKDQVILTSAFDGAVYSWDINEVTESNMNYDKVFYMNGLMRMKLSPDDSKLIITTTAGFIVLIHDLNLSTLARDLRFFRPNLYRLMQLSNQSFPVATIYNYLFDPKRKQNRIEFIDDFPSNAEIISSLEIHPYGWSAATRYMSEKELNEYTVIHDIQGREEKDYDSAFMYIEESADMDDENFVEESPDRRHTDMWMGSLTYEDYTTGGNGQARQEMGIISSGLIGSNPVHKEYFQRHPEEKYKVFKNLPRMTHFIKETSIAKSFIKEISFSFDGKVLCSPYSRGIQLLAFNDQCQELADCVPERPQPLRVAASMRDTHQNVVVSCKFSPVNYQIVSGCLGGDIKWYEPLL